MVFRAGLRSVITICPKGKNVLHTESAMHYEYENLQLYLGNYKVEIWCKWLMFSEFSKNAVTCIFGNVLNIPKARTLIISQS